MKYELLPEVAARHAFWERVGMVYPSSERLAQIQRSRGYIYETITHYRGERWVLRTNDEKTSIRFTTRGDAYIQKWMARRWAIGDVNAFEKVIEDFKYEELERVA